MCVCVVSSSKSITILISSVSKSILQHFLLSFNYYSSSGLISMVHRRIFSNDKHVSLIAGSITGCMLYRYNPGAINNLALCNKISFLLHIFASIISRICGFFLKVLQRYILNYVLPALSISHEYF